MKRRDFLKLSTQAIAITAAVPALAKVDVETSNQSLEEWMLRDAREKYWDGKQWDEEIQKRFKERTQNKITTFNLIKQRI